MNTLKEAKFQIPKVLSCVDDLANIIWRSKCHHLFQKGTEGIGDTSEACEAQL